jgi:hypothetical protein
MASRVSHLLTAHAYCVGVARCHQMGIFREVIGSLARYSYEEH